MKDRADLPPGFRFVDGRWYWRPTNQAARLALAEFMPGKTSIAAGNTPQEAMEWFERTMAKRIERHVRRGKARGHLLLPRWSMKESKENTRQAYEDRLYALLAGSAEDNGLVYFIRAGATNSVKIGYTTSIETLWKRIDTMQTGSSEPLDLLDKFNGSRSLERACHHLFAHERIKGEWFRNQGLVFRARLRARSVGLKAALEEFVNSDKFQEFIAKTRFYG